MSQTDASLSLPSPVVRTLADLGQGIRTARLRRRETAREFAGRLGVSLPTLRKLERGDPSVSLGVFATALWVLGLLDQVRDEIRPEADRLAAALEAAAVPRRIRHKRVDDLDQL